VGLSLPPPNLALKDLSSLVGEDAAREIVTLFLNSFPESMRSINVSSRPDQMRIAHGLKSSALHMGALALSERIGEIEDKLARPGATFDHRDLEPAITEFEAFATDLRKYAQA
jgi:hypothetical protein